MSRLRSGCTMAAAMMAALVLFEFWMDEHSLTGATTSRSTTMSLKKEVAARARGPIDISLLEEWHRLINETESEFQRNKSSAVEPRHTTVPNALRRTCPSSFGKSSVTAVTQLGITKLHRLLLQARRWAGPVSAAVYLTGPEDVENLVQFWKDHTPDAYRNGLCHISAHVVMEYVPQNQNNVTLASLGYPHNIMRNVAMDHSDSDYFATFDADFMTFLNAHQILQTTLTRTLRRKMTEERTLLVMPAFDSVDDRAWLLPETRQDALQAMPSDLTKDALKKIKKQTPDDSAGVGVVYPFHGDVFPAGHRATNFTRWIELDEADPDDAWYDIEYSNAFEPYVVGYQDRKEVRRYHELFRGFGFNKLSWIMDMHCHGYQFAVMRDMAVVHLWHTLNSKAHRDEFTTRGQSTFDDFRNGLKREHPQCKFSMK